MRQNHSISGNRTEKTEEVVTSVLFIEDPDNNQYIVRSVDCSSSSYGPTTFKTIFKYDISDREAAFEKAKSFENQRKSSLGLAKGINQAS